MSEGCTLTRRKGVIMVKDFIALVIFLACWYVALVIGLQI